MFLSSVSVYRFRASLVRSSCAAARTFVEPAPNMNKQKLSTCLLLYLSPTITYPEKYKPPGGERETAI